MQESGDLRGACTDDVVVRLAAPLEYCAADIEQIEARAEAGDAEAIHILATWHVTGLKGLVEKDEARGVEGLRRASAMGAAYASYSLGTLHERGQAVPQSGARAFEYYVLALAQGAQEAAEEIFRLYYYGIGVEKDEGLLEAWHKIADTAAERLSRCFGEVERPKLVRFSHG